MNPEPPQKSTGVKVPTLPVRPRDPLIDPECAVYRRAAFGFVFVAVVAAILYPRSGDLMDINPLAGPLILIASGRPVVVLLGALVSGLCLSGMLSVVIWPNARTVAAAGLAIATWLVSSITLLGILAS